jgi:hypothetical protein
VQVVQTFDNDETDASIKGDTAHKLLEDAIKWGVVPDSGDVDMEYAVMLAHEYVENAYMIYKEKSKCRMCVEETLEIPETGEYGTPDIVFVTDTTIEIVDYKNGYVPVDVYLNPQFMLYLLGAIAKYGERKHYKLTVIQPNYVHRDGMIRHYEPSENDIAWFRHEVGLAVASTTIIPGKHCKKSYCPARGTCQHFLAWAQENLKDAYYPGDAVAMSDEQLATAMEDAEVLKGWHDALRGEALRRMLQQGKTINGYKVVKAKQNRAFNSDKAREQVYNNLRYLGVDDEALADKSPIGPAGVEKIVKKIFKHQGRGAWLKGMDQVCPTDLLTPQNQSLTVEKSIDGRREYKRGQEFDALK